MVCVLRPAYFRVYWVAGWDAEDGDANGGMCLREYATYAEALDNRTLTLSARMLLRLHHGEGHLAIVNHQGSVLWSEVPQPVPAISLGQEVA